MSDEEWERWRAAFQKGGRVMPDIVRRARIEGLRARWGMGAIYAVATAAVLFELWSLVHKDGMLDRAMIALACVFVGVMVGAASAAIQGTWSAQGDAPLEALAALERRNAARERVLVVKRWGLGIFCVASFALSIALGRGVPGEPPSKLAWLAVPVVALVLVNRRLRARFDRDRREIAEARKLLAEPEAPEDSERPS